MKSFVWWLLSLSVFSLLVAGFFHPITAFTQDLGRHLLMGQQILINHSVPSINLLSYTYPTFPFINHHYLSEVLFYLFYGLAGENGLLLLMTSIVVIAFGLVFFYSAKKARIIPTSLLSFFYLRVLFERTDIRPEMFGYLLLSIFLVSLYHYRENYTKWILLLIPLELLWVQLHISFIIGIVVLGLFFIDNVLNNRKKLYNPSTLLLLFVVVFSTLVTLLNPNGIIGALYPFHIFQNYGYTVEENQTIFLLESLFAKPTIPYFKISVLLLFISLFSVIKKTRPIDWLLAITFTYLGASAVRNFPLFVLATIIPASLALSAVFNWIKPLLPTSSFTKLTLIITPYLLVCLFLWTIPSTVSQRGFGFGKITGAEKAADFYSKNKLSGPVFNNFDIGSYLEYRIFPTQRVFIDGRPEAYPSSFIQKTYIPMQEDPAVFSSIDKKYQFKTLFFAHTDQTPWAKTFLQSIIQNKTWVPIYLDHDVIILVKNIPEHESLIKKFGMSPNTFFVSQMETYSHQELLQLMNFYITVQLPAQEISTAQAILQKDPNNCQVLSFLISLLTQQQDQTATIYMQRFDLFCR